MKKPAHKVAKVATASALMAPLVLPSPIAHNVLAEPLTFHDWVNMQIGESLEIGETVSLDLSNYFGDLEDATFMIINHNDQVAVITINDGEMTIDGKNSGSTMVDLIIENTENPPVNERFRIYVDPASSLIDEHGDGIGLDDIVRYIRTNPEQTFRQENIKHLLQHVSTIIRMDNRSPRSSDEPATFTLTPGELTLINLNDFFFDPDGDQLQFTFDYDEEIVEVQQDEHMAAIGGFGLIGTQSMVHVTAHDQQSGKSVSKTIILSFAPGETYRPPKVNEPILNQVAWVNELFTYSIPQHTFSKATAFDQYTYSATLENGDTLPSWLTFDPETLTFSGVPIQDGPDPIEGTLAVRVTATSGTGDHASTIFKLIVAEYDGTPVALYENVDVAMHTYYYVNIDTTTLFTTMDDEPFEIVGADGRKAFDSPDGSLASDLYPDGILYVFHSGSFVDPIPDYASLVAQPQAKGADESLSDIVNVKVTKDMRTLDPIVVQAGSQVSLSSLLSDYFSTYTLDGQPFTFKFSAQSEWFEVDPDDNDLIYILPGAPEEIQLRPNVSGLNGAIQMFNGPIFTLKVIPYDEG